MSVEEALMEAKKSATSDGRLAVDYDSLAAAAFVRGLALPKPVTVYKRLRELGAVKAANGPTGTRFAFDRATLDAIAYEARVNRIEGAAFPVTLIASLTFPSGITIAPDDFAEGYPLPSAASLKITPNNLYTSHDEPPQRTEGAWVALSLRPDSVSAAALALLIKAEYEAGSHSGRMTSGRADQVSLSIPFADGSSADLSQGSLICFGRQGATVQFLFFFTQLNRDY